MPCYSAASGLRSMLSTETLTVSWTGGSRPWSGPAGTPTICRSSAGPRRVREREADDREDTGGAELRQAHPYEFSHNWLEIYDSKVGKRDS